jgi:uncharacterized membrane protein
MKHSEKTTSGLDANEAAALSYLVGFVSGIVFLHFEKENRYVRFHAMQSTVFFLGAVAVDLLMQIIAPKFLGFLVVVSIVIPSAVVWLLMMYKAYQGEEYKLPVVGQWAADRI